MDGRGSNLSKGRCRAFCRGQPLERGVKEGDKRDVLFFSVTEFLSFIVNIVRNSLENGSSNDVGSQSKGMKDSAFSLAIPTKLAVLAVQNGVAGIMVSNHGARQLDHVPASISVLEEVVKAVAGRVPVFLDGGVRRGTDVFKALALGASGVFVGRPVPFALAVDGEAGARKALQMLRDELELTMALMGVCSVNDIRRQHVQTEHDAIKPLLSRL